MGAGERRNKDVAMAAHLIKIGYHHGRRPNSPNPHSGGAVNFRRGQCGLGNVGLTDILPGSAANRRLAASTRAR